MNAFMKNKDKYTVDRKITINHKPNPYKSTQKGQRPNTNKKKINHITTNKVPQWPPGKAVAPNTLPEKQDQKETSFPIKKYKKK